MAQLPALALAAINRMIRLLSVAVSDRTYVGLVGRGSESAQATAGLAGRPHQALAKFEIETVAVLMLALARVRVSE